MISSPMDNISLSRMLPSFLYAINPLSRPYPEIWDRDRGILVGPIKIYTAGDSRKAVVNVVSPYLEQLAIWAGERKVVWS